MTRQAAPPAQRWLLLSISLLVAQWLGQGVASAYSVSVNPQSGPPGTSVTVTLSDFGPGCYVSFDGAAVAGDTGCEDETPLVFVVPPDATAGNHELRAVEVGLEGEVTRQALTFRVTTAPGPATTQATAAPTPSTTVAPDADAEGATVVAAGTATTRAGSSPTTVAQPGTTTAGPVRATPALPEVFAAGCPPRQVALMRFSVKPTRAPPAGRVSATTSWGSVGTCTGVRSLRVLFDGQPVTGAPPEAGTPGSFEVTIPEAATTGGHKLSLVAADDFSVELASVAFVIDRGVEGSDVPLIVGLIVTGVILLLALILAVRRRRKRKGAFVDDLEAAPGDGWDGLLDVPDLAAPIGAAPIGAAPIGAAPIAAAAIDTTAIPVLDPEVTAIAGVAFEDDPTMPVVPLVVSSGRDGSFYLLERQNPHAPRQPNGKRGWYRPQRSTPVRGIVGRQVDPHTAGAAASELATGEAPASAHVVIDVDGPLELLPDDIVAVHRPGLDDAVLVMLLAGFGADPASDEMIVSHAAAWSAAKMREHAIPTRIVDTEELRAGRGGLLSDDQDFPWHRIVALEASSEAPAVPADDVVAAGEPVPAAEPEPAGGLTDPTPVAAWEDAPAEPVPAPVADPPPGATDAPAPTDTAAPTDAPSSAPAPAPTPSPPTAPPARRSGSRALPAPDELIARAAGATAYFLVENENPHATLRANGKHGWYYPTRYGGIRAVVLHSPGGGDTAEAVAARLATVDQPEAAHAVIDPDTIVDLLPDEATALHGVRSSSAALDLALAYDPALWGTDPAAEEALLVRAAAWAGVRAVRHGIPVRRITVDAWHTGQGGFAANGDVDPGPDFPWDRFLQLTAWVAGRVAAGRPPLTTVGPPAGQPDSGQPDSGQPATDPSETVRSGSQPT